MTRPDTRRLRRAVPAVVALALLVTGCGTRQSHDAVIAAAGTVDAAQGSVAGDGVAGDTALAGGATAPGPGAGPAAAAGRSVTGSARTGSVTGRTRVGTSTAGDHTPLVIGEVGTFSGLVGAGGVPMRSALRAWVQAVNAEGGVAGHPVRLVSIDDQGNTSKAQAAVRKLVEQEHVVAIVASYVGLTISSIAKYVNDKGIPMIGGDMASYGWFQNPMFFPQGTHVALQLYGVLQQIAASGKPKAALFYCTEAAICEQERGQLRAYAAPAHVDVVYEAKVSLAQPDFTAQCLNARSAGADALIVVMDGGSMRRIVRDCVRQSYRPAFWTGAQVVSDDDKSDPDMDGVQVVTQTFGWILSGTPAQSAFQTAMRRYAPGAAVDGSASMGWTAAELLRAAVLATGARATTGPVTTTLVLDGLYSLHGTTLSGLAPESLTFHRGKANAGARCYWTMALHAGRWTMAAGGKQSCVPASVVAP